MPARRFYEISALALAGCFMLHLATTYLPIYKRAFETWPPGAFFASVVFLVVTLMVIVTAMQLNFDWFPAPGGTTWSEDTKMSLGFTAKVHDVGIVALLFMVAILNPGGYKFYPRLPGASWDLGAVAVTIALLAILIWRTQLMQRKAVIAPDDWGE